MYYLLLPENFRHTKTSSNILFSVFQVALTFNLIILIQSKKNSLFFIFLQAYTNKIVQQNPLLRQLVPHTPPEPHTQTIPAAPYPPQARTESPVTDPASLH